MSTQCPECVRIQTDLCRTCQIELDEFLQAMNDEWWEGDTE